MIYDWNEWYVSKNWFFTALTRSTDLNRVKFFRCTEGEGNKSRKIVEQILRERF